MSHDKAPKPPEPKASALIPVDFALSMRKLPDAPNARPGAASGKLWEITWLERNPETGQMEKQVEVLSKSTAMGRVQHHCTTMIRLVNWNGVSPNRRANPKDPGEAAR